MKVGKGRQSLPSKFCGVWNQVKHTIPYSYTSKNSSSNTFLIYYAVKMETTGLGDFIRKVCSFLIISNKEVRC